MVIKMKTKVYGWKGQHYNVDVIGSDKKVKGFKSFKTKSEASKFAKNLNDMQWINETGVWN